MQHDKAWPHTARSTVAPIQDLSFECLPHPLYSPDLAPSDFHVFGQLKEAMGGKYFRSDESRLFLEVSMHYRNAGTLVWYAMETT